MRPDIKYLVAVTLLILLIFINAFFVVYFRNSEVSFKESLDELKGNLGELKTSQQKILSEQDELNKKVKILEETFKQIKLDKITSEIVK